MSNNHSGYGNPGIYKPRNPKASLYYQCVADHFVTLEMVWEDRYERQYGFWRSWTKAVVYRYLDCGDLHCGFARVKCKGCGHEYLLAFFCKRHHFCAFCHRKWIIDFGEDYARRFSTLSLIYHSIDRLNTEISFIST